MSRKISGSPNRTENLHACNSKSIWNNRLFRFVSTRFPEKYFLLSAIFQEGRWRSSNMTYLGYLPMWKCVKNVTEYQRFETVYFSSSFCPQLSCRFSSKSLINPEKGITKVNVFILNILLARFHLYP